MNTRNLQTRRLVVVNYPCISCKQEVTANQQAMQCDGCNNWLHRRCTRGLALAIFDDAMRRNQEFEWKCANCMATPTVNLPLAECPGVSEVNGANMHDDEDARESPVNAFTDAELSRLEADPPVAESSRISEAMDDTRESLITDGSVTTEAPNEHDSTFIEYERVFPVTENSIDDDDVIEDCEVNDMVTYSVVEGASQRYRRKLVDNRGYSYTVKRVNNDGSVTWRCSIRNKVDNCPATVTQRRDRFRPGIRKHSHLGKPGQEVKYAVVSDIKRKASQEIFTPAGHIVEQALLEHVTDGPISALPSQIALQRQVNRFRAAQRPNDPADLTFTLEEHALPEGFLRADVFRGRKRHLIFASEEQLNILARGKRWYVDGTFKMVKTPFVQLLSIHCFVRKDTETKQIPLCFILMSSKKKHDYIAVLEEIRRILPQDISVQECVLDFEDGLWRAMAQVFPDVHVHGCSFHWAQAVWRKIQEVGLATAYLAKEATHSHLRKLMALPYLPCEAIPEMFQKLLEKAETPKLLQVFAYTRSRWITDESIWPPRVWSVFGQSIRTNNDVEGWHNRMNLRARKANLPLYLLIQLLHEESRLVHIQVRFVKDGKLRRYQRRTYKNLHGRLNTYWQEFNEGTRNARSLLNACSHLYG